MSVSFKIKKKSNKLQKLAKQFSTINKESVEVGHFSESGIHQESDMSYPDLMALHHNGDPEVNLPARPVLSILAFRNKKLNSGDIRRAIFNWGSRKHGRLSDERLLSDIGKVLAEEEKDIFGSPSLIDNSPITIRKKGRNAPLVDSGDLKENTSYKTSISKTLKK